jgi:hypothetical protein
MYKMPVLGHGASTPTFINSSGTDNVALYSRRNNHIVLLTTRKLELDPMSD